jgi:multidrug efflux pump subunit AcrA (membrane-fusion protein)
MPEQRWRPQIVKPDPNQTWAENLRYSIDVFDAGDNLIEVLGRLADLDPARAAFAATMAKYPAKRIFLRTGARVLARSDEPPEWLTAYRSIPVFKENP